MEIRIRAAALLQKIEGSLLTSPTMVRLDFKDASLADIVQDLSQQTGMRISLFPENLPRWKQEHVNLQEVEPLPFWKAVDLLCTASSLQIDLELRSFSMHNQPTLALIDRITRPVHPICDHGPFRVSLVGLEFQRHVGFAVAMPRVRANPGQAERPAAPKDLAPLRPRPVTSVQCSVQLQVTAEPRLSVNQTGAIQILEARDDQGNSLRMDKPGSPVLTSNAGYFGGSCSSVVHARAALNRPENPGRTIKILRGSVPLRITARQPDPLVVPLSTATGKAFDSTDLHISVHEVRFDPNTRQRQIELTVRESRSGVLPAADDEPVAELGSRIDPHQQNIEIVDARGHIVPWIQTSVDMESSRITLSMAGPASTEPKELRYYRLSECAVNVPFTFSEVPMP